MANLGTIARRTFLLGSVAIAGGVAFGYYAINKPHKNPLLDDLADGEASFNAWVKITSESVTLITPHTDLGQGAFSMQAALIAEELDIEFGQFDVSPGKPDAAYYNTVSGGELAPYLSTDKSLSAEAMRGLYGAVIKLMGMQVTGGSSAVADSFEKLRMAGAVARETLKKAAAAQTGVAVNDLKTANGAVQLPDGSELQYTALAGAAANIKPVSNVRLRDPSEWRMVGKPMQRLDIVPKSTGRLTYGIDLEFDGMVHAAVKTNPRRGGALLSYDADAAKNMRGVQKIVEVTDGVAVIANNTWRAFNAVNAIECEWAPAPYPAEMSAHWQALSNSFTNERLDKEWRHDGDVNKALDGADIIEAEYRAPYVAHAPLEPISAIVLVGDDRVDIWVAHQIPRFAQQRVADITGFDVDDVHLHNQYAGGSFGHRLEFDNVDRAAEIATQMNGVPVKLTFSREEDFTHDYPRQIAMSRARGAVKAGGVDAYDLNIASVSSSDSQSARAAFSRTGADGQIAAGAGNMPYDIPNLRVTAYKAPELAPTSSWRSVGASTAGFFCRRFS